MKHSFKFDLAAFVQILLRYVVAFIIVFALFFSIELLSFGLLKPDGYTGLLFGLLWACMLSLLILSLPHLAGRIVFGIIFFVMLLWTLAQSGYYQVFGKMMWVSTISYAGEGADYISDVLGYFPALWWIGLVVLMTAGILTIWKFPQTPANLFGRITCVLLSIIAIVGLSHLPKMIYKLDENVAGAQTEYKQSSSYKATYTTMFDAKRVYDITGIYQLTLRDIWINELYPITPEYRSELKEKKALINDYFRARGEKTFNNMTGTYSGKNVILVLMESIDDWMITPDETPTMYKMMQKGINFTNFYTPGYGSARTLNSEFCMNTGIYLPTTGKYLFDYVTNSFDQSIASQLNTHGYHSLVFHYNDPAFYSREVFEPAMGYEKYVAYCEYVNDPKLLWQDTLLFDLPQIRDLFFRDGQTFNTIITRAAHLGYTYNEIIDYYALKEYPEYRGKYPSEEEDCARLKAMLVDKMFARLLRELEDRGQLDNTVIIAMTDHYTYGYKNMEELYAHSGVTEDLLLEKTPCFVWSTDSPSIQVTKTLNTADLLPTVLNLLGIESPYNYLGQDAFDANYRGYALFPDGSWICDGVAWQNGKVIMNQTGRNVSTDEIAWMAKESEEYRNISNLLLISDYYQ